MALDATSPKSAVGGWLGHGASVGRTGSECGDARSHASMNANTFMSGGRGWVEEKPCG